MIIIKMREDACNFFMKVPIYLGKFFLIKSNKPLIFVARLERLTLVRVKNFQ